MYNFSPATPDEEMVFGACRPAHPRHAPSDHSVDDWLDYMDQQDVERVCCLLDDSDLAAYDGLLDAYTDHFGPERVCHSPIEDFESVGEAPLQETILPFLETAVERSERVVVHCSAGQGRTGHVLALWLVHGRGYDLDEAIEVVQGMGRSPLEAVTRSELEDLVYTMSTENPYFLGISEEHVIEHVEGESEDEYEESEACTLTYNQTDPMVISDGIDRVAVVEEADDRYLVDYWGYLIGYLRVTSEGITDLGEHLLGDHRPIPRWIIDSPPGSVTLPWWIPDDYDGEPTLSCDRCDTATPAGEIVTPGSMEGDPEEKFCRECWETIRDYWVPDMRFDRKSSLDQADELCSEATSSPNSIDLEDVYDLLQISDPDVQHHALVALETIAQSRTDEVVDFVPALESFLDSDDSEIRRATLGCLAVLAEEYPEHVTPVSADVVTCLDPAADETLHEDAVAIVAAIADHEPGAVVDAVPKLAALLQDGTSNENGAVLAMIRIAKAYPEAVMPVAKDLVGYVEADDRSNRVAALAALGYVSKEYPNVAESTIPTLIDLLDADSHRLQANAAGLLAELADEYPDQLRNDVPRIIELLDDGDEKARYNATSILARIAKAHPDDVEPAIKPLIDALDEEFTFARSNACWALGYLEASEAEEKLESLADSDPDDEVQNAAEWALQQL